MKEAERITREQVDNVNIKYIPDTDDTYAVSRDGKVYSFTPKANGRALKPGFANKYLIVAIRYPGETKWSSKYIHRLVAGAFIPNPSHLSQINHLDENTLNNNVENLAWCDARENCNWGKHRDNIKAALKKYYTDNRRHHFVAKLDDDDNVIQVYPSMAAAAESIIVPRLNKEKSVHAARVQISKICAGVPHCVTAGGYKWRYATEEEERALTEQMSILKKEEKLKIALEKLKKAEARNKAKEERDKEKERLREEKLLYRSMSVVDPHHPMKPEHEKMDLPKFKRKKKTIKENEKLVVEYRKFNPKTGEFNCTVIEHTPVTDASVPLF